MDGNDYHKITTDNNGKFVFGVTMPVGEGYAVQAVYDGSLNYKSSKSQTEYFDVRMEFAPGSGILEDGATLNDAYLIGTLFWIVIASVVVIPIVVIAKKRKKKIFVN